MLSEIVYLEPGLLLSAKEVKYKEIGLYEDITLKMSSELYYLDIPVHLGYKYQFADTISAFIRYHMQASDCSVTMKSQHLTKLNMRK